MPLVSRLMAVYQTDLFEQMPSLPIELYFVPAVAVGAVGTPEKPGDTNGALAISSSLRDLKFPSIS